MKLLPTLLITAATFALFARAASTAETYNPAKLSASEIFRNSAQASGVRASGTYTETMTTQVGGVQWTSITTIDGPDYQTTTTGGGFSSSYGSRDGRPWREDENGVVVMRSNFHLHEDPNALAFQHPDDPQYNVRVLGITQSEPQQYVVELNPPDGYDEYCYYDVKTSLLTKVVQYTRDRYRHVTEYSDYRDTFGRTIAFTTHSYDGRPQNDRTTTVQSFVKADARSDLTIPTGRPLFTYTGAKPVQLPARFTRAGIIVRAVVNGRGLDFLLDSGAAGLFIDPGVAHELGLTPYGRTAATIGGGDVDVGPVRIPKMTIGDLELDGPVFETSAFTVQSGDTKVVGLIGFDFLANGIYGIDFKKQTLTLYPSNQFDPKALGLTGLPLQLDDGLPRTDAFVEGVRGHFVVDTGAFKLLIYRDFANRLPSAVSETSQSAIGTVGGKLSSSIVDLTDIIFGGIKFNSGQAVEPNKSTFDIADYDGLIGRDVLQNFQAYFDYADGALFVKPNL